MKENFDDKEIDDDNVITKENFIITIVTLKEYFMKKKFDNKKV